MGWTREIQAATSRRLSAWVRQASAGDGYECEYGHHGCGCTNAASMDGNAPCSSEVSAEQEERKERRARSGF